MSFHTDASHAGDIFCWTMMTLHWRVLICLGLFRTLYDVSILGDSCIVRVYTYTVLVRNQWERRKWKISLNEMKLILEGPIFHFHDYGRKSIFGAKVVICHNLSVPCFEQSVLSMCTTCWWLDLRIKEPFWSCCSTSSALISGKDRGH